ncbi:hypothetical protein H7K45_24970 [Mycobacterium yunnanensis]|uniref:Uncharacterized protein n=1 Tax=Mycobacterium yunnanensis TaxID=368477 RepID=A0A9X2Z9H9_9MYCO|nr:hypothetical protein [Mycobacterium yunnanensis]MCV7423812.1 hypothetical protein [Mycobacterium yunnanensis]
MPNADVVAGEPVDPVSPAGQLYLAMASELLTAEFDRRKTLESRGSALLTSSGTLLTLIFGLTVIVTGKDHVYADRCSVILLLAALVAFVLSAVIAIFVQTYGFRYAVLSQDGLRSLPRDDAEWARRADDATRAMLSKKVSTICSLRNGNNTKATLVAFSLGFQVVAIALLSASVGFELWGRV